MNNTESISQAMLAIALMLEHGGWKHITSEWVERGFKLYFKSRNDKIRSILFLTGEDVAEWESYSLPQSLAWMEQFRRAA
jgi:hypothetical protein